MNRFDAFFCCDDTFPGVTVSRGQATTSGDQVLDAQGRDFLLTGAPDVELLNNQIVSITDSGAGGTSKVAYCRVVKRTTTPSQKVLLVPVQTSLDDAGVIGLTFKSGATITGRNVFTDVLTLVVDLSDAPPATNGESYTYCFAVSGALTSPQVGRSFVRVLSKSLVGDPLAGAGSTTIGDALLHITTGGVSAPPFNFAWWETLTPGQRYEFRVLIGISATQVNTLQVINPRIWAARVSALFTATQVAEVTTTSVLPTTATVCSTGAVIPAGTYLVLAGWMHNANFNAAIDTVLTRLRLNTAGTNFDRADFSPININEYASRGFASVMTLGAGENVQLNHALAAAGSGGLTSKVKQAYIAVMQFSSAVIQQMISRAPADGTNSSLTADAWNTLLDSDQGASPQSLAAGTWVEFISTCNLAIQRLRPDWNTLSMIEPDVRGFARLDDDGAVGTRRYANFFLSRHRRPLGNQTSRLLTRTPAATTSQAWSEARFSFLLEGAVASPRFDSPVVVAAELETGVIYKQWVSAGTDKWQLDLADVGLVTRVAVNGVDYAIQTSVGNVNAAKEWFWDASTRRITIQMDSGDSPADLDRTVVLGVPLMVGRSGEALTDDDGLARQYYAQLSTTPSVGQALDVKSTGCEVATSFGKIELLRPDRDFDDLLARRVIDGMRLRVYRGWRDLTTRLRDMQQILAGALGRPSLASKRLSIDVHDISLTLKRPVAKTTISVYEGTVQRADKLMPVIYGCVRRVPAYRTTNAGTPDTYRVTNAHQVKAIGALNSAGGFDAKAFKDGEAAGAANTIVVTLSTATFTLAVGQPDYGADVLYVDVLGITDTGASSGTALTKPGEIARHLVTTYGGLSGSDLVESSFRLIDRTWRQRRSSSGVLVPLGVQIGVYLTEQTVAEALSLICQATFAFWGETRRGRLRLGVPDVEAANLLVNGSFENDANAATPWFPGGDASITDPLTTTVKYFGARAAVVSNGNNGYVGQRVVIPQPQKYVATCVAALQSGDGTAFRIGIITPDEGLTPQLSEPIEITSAYWTRASALVDVPVGGAGSAQVVLVPYLSQGRVPATPTAVSGIKLWLDATKITGKVTGDSISQWNDLSSQGNHATQGTAAKQPKFISGGIAGQPCVRFDGNDDALSTPLSVTAFGITVFVVYRVREFNDLTASSNHRVLSGSNDWMIGPHGGVNRAKVSSSFTPTSGAPAVDAFRTVLVTLRQANGSSSALFVNGAQQGADNLTAAQTGPGTISIGAAGGTIEPGVFDVAEVLVFDRALNVNRRTAWETYFMQKWGIAAASVVVDTVRAVPVGLVVHAASDPVIESDIVEAEPHARDAIVKKIDLEEEVFFEARVPFSVNLQKADRASAGIVTEAEARGLLSSYDPDAAEGKAVLRAAGRLDMGKLGDAAGQVSDVLLQPAQESSYGVAAAMAFFFGRQRNRLSLDVMDFDRVPEVGEFLYAESVRGIPRTPSEDPLWMLVNIDDESDPATELAIEATREMDPVADRHAISPTEIPLGAVVVCTAAACPTDYEEVTTQRGLCLIGAIVADQMTIQGAATHRHLLDHDHGGAPPAHHHTAKVKDALLKTSRTRIYDIISGQEETEQRPAQVFGPSSAHPALFARGPGSGDHGHPTTAGAFTSNDNVGGDVAGTPSLSTFRGSNDVEHINVLFCRRVARTIATIPASIVLGYSSATAPSSWTRQASFYGLAVRGADPGNTGFVTRAMSAGHTQADLGAWLQPSSLDDVFIGQRIKVIEGANSYNGIVLALDSGAGLFFLLPTHATGDTANGTAYSSSATITALSSDVGTTRTLAGTDMPDHLHVRSGADGTGAIDAHEHAVVHEHEGIASGAPTVSQDDANLTHLIDTERGFFSCILSPHYHLLIPLLEAQAADKGAAQVGSPFGGTLTGATQAAPPRFAQAFINNTGGTETIVPVGARYFFEGAACPPGSSHVSNADGRIIAGSASGQGDVVTDGDHAHVAVHAAHAFSHGHGGTTGTQYSERGDSWSLADNVQPKAAGWVEIGDETEEHVHEVVYDTIQTVDPTLPAETEATGAVLALASSDPAQASSKLPFCRSLILCQRN